MNVLTDPACVIAMAEAARALRTYVQKSGTLQQNILLLSVVAGIAGIWLVLYLWDTRRRAEKPQVALATPPGLFQQLCRKHQLSESERRLLEQAATGCQLEQPDRLFIDMSYLQQMCRAGGPEAAGYAALLERLFGATAPQGASSSS